MRSIQPIRNLAMLGLAVAPFLLLVGCTGATDVSKQPTPQEVEQAKQRQAAAAEQRSDLTPEQREGLKKYYGGGGGQGAPGYQSGGPARR